jgi:hypothetical protein
MVYNRIRISIFWWIINKYIEVNSDRISKLEKYSHPSQEFICCRKCGCKIAKTKKRR